MAHFYLLEPLSLPFFLNFVSQLDQPIKLAPCHKSPLRFLLVVLVNDFTGETSDNFNILLLYFWMFSWGGLAPRLLALVLVVVLLLVLLWGVLNDRLATGFQCGGLDMGRGGVLFLVVLLLLVLLSLFFLLFLFAQYLIKHGL